MRNGRGALVCLLAVLMPTLALAHAIGGKDAAFVAATSGPAALPFAYLGAKHMVTGYDHLLFLLGVIFFLHRLRDVALYVTLFSIGHSLTLATGVAANLNVSSYLVDAVIGLSVAWKGFDNLGGFRVLFGVQPDNRLVVLCFGLVHGFGLATKLQDLHLKPEGLGVNLASFNIGVEMGQLLVLSFLVLGLAILRGLPLFMAASRLSNAALITAGFIIAGGQFAGHVLSGSAS